MADRPAERHDQPAGEVEHVIGLTAEQDDLTSETVKEADGPPGTWLGWRFCV